MKRNVLRLIAFLLICATVTSSFLACRDTVTEESPTPTVDIVRDGKSDYVLVNNSADPIGSYLSDEIWSLIYNTYGASLSKRADGEQYGYEIVVGNAARDRVSELAGKLSGGADFAILQDGNRLYLYANTFEGAKRMTLALRDHFIPNSGEGALRVDEGLCFVGSAHPEVITHGNAVELFANGNTQYTIIYNAQSDSDEQVAYYLRRAMSQASGKKPGISDYKKSNSEYEIVIGTGTLQRDEYGTVRKALKGDDQFIMAVSGSKLILTATDAKALIRGVEYLNTAYLQNPKDGTCRVYESDETRTQIDSKGFALSYDRAVELYIDILGTYPTMYDMYYDKTVSGLSKTDQQLIEALIARMGGSIVLMNGSSSMLYNGMICKLDKTDYSRVAALSATSATVPAAFANTYLNANYASDTAVDLKAAAEGAGYAYYYDSSRGLAILTPNGVESFADDSVKVGDHTNAQYKDRMVKFFNNASMPEPQNNTEQSRVVIGDATDYFPEDSYDYTQPIYTCYYSPGILTVGETVYTSVEHCKVKEGDELSSKTVIRKSTDSGTTWEITHEIDRLKWAAMFLVGDQMYIVGFLKDDGSWKGGTWIGRVTDDGNAKTVETVELSKLCDDVSAIFEPMIIDGILYLPLDSTVMSASVTSDITKASVWTRTQDSAELISKEWFRQVTGKSLNSEGSAECLEGNIVKGRDGEIYVIYRIESQPYGNYAIMLKLSQDKTRLELLPNNGSLLKLPTTVSRFVIKYDESTDLYICISNWYLTDNACRARNVLGLSVSDDLIDWKTVDTLLVDREMINTECSCWRAAFQYTDWDFDGDDLVLAVRETVGFANTFHDGKYFTFYRVSNYRDLIASAS